MSLHYPEDDELVETGGVPSHHNALLKGHIDTGLRSITWTYSTEKEGMNNLGDITHYISDWKFVSSNGNLQWAREHADLLVRFLGLLLRST